MNHFEQLYNILLLCVYNLFSDDIRRAGAAHNIRDCILLYVIQLHNNRILNNIALAIVADKVVNTAIELLLLFRFSVRPLISRSKPIEEYTTGLTYVQIDILCGRGRGTTKKKKKHNGQDCRLQSRQREEGSAVSPAPELLTSYYRQPPSRLSAAVTLLPLPKYIRMYSMTRLQSQ